MGGNPVFRVVCGKGYIEIRFFATKNICAYSKQSRDRKGAVTALAVIQWLTAWRTQFL